MEIKFFVLMRGAFTPPPRIEEPVIMIPLSSLSALSSCFPCRGVCTMLLRQLIIQCTIRCLNPPTHMAIHLPRIVRTVPNVNLQSFLVCRLRTYVESLSVASEEHIWSTLVVVLCAALDTLTSSHYCQCRRSTTDSIFETHLDDTN